MKKPPFWIFAGASGCGIVQIIVWPTISQDTAGGSCLFGRAGVSPSGNVSLKTIGASTGAFPTLEIEKYQSRS